MSNGLNDVPRLRKLKFAGLGVIAIGSASVLIRLTGVGPGTGRSPLRDGLVLVIGVFIYLHARRELARQSGEG